MKKFVALAVCVLFVFASSSLVWGKDSNGHNGGSGPDKADLGPETTNIFAAAAANTTVLGWWQFDTAIGIPTPQGWAPVDITAQVSSYFHIDGPLCPTSAAAEICPGKNQHMWCGQWVTSLSPWCGWATLPGYGNDWNQALVSQIIPCDTLTWSYFCSWDSEPGYDFTYPEYWDNSAGTWVTVGSANGGQGSYDGTGSCVFENLSIQGNGGSTQLRYRFASDIGRSDEDALWPTSEGAFKVDEITVTSTGLCSYTNFENFEAVACHVLSSGIWSSQPIAPFGSYGSLHSALSVVQEDPCLRTLSNLWGFFDNPGVTNYACGGWPAQGAIPYGPNQDGLYMSNQVWSPWVANTGAGTEYRFQFLMYSDLPLDNLQFGRFAIRTKDSSGCPTFWHHPRFSFYAGQKNWARLEFDVGAFIPASADSIQCAVGVVDLCDLWCGLYGTGACHSHAPLFDQVKLVRVETFGPQWHVRHIDLFNDNFPEDGTIGCASSARADMALDILPLGNPNIVPGDSAVVEVAHPSFVYTPLSPPSPQPNTAIPPQVYCYVRVGSHVVPPCTPPGHTPTGIQSPDNVRYPGDPMAGTLRYPYLGTATCGSWTYWKYQCDFVYTPGGGVVPDQYCIDLMDIYNGLHAVEDVPGNVGAFVPGDTVYYFFEAAPNADVAGYWHREKAYRLGQGASNQTTGWNEACHQPCEFMILPDSGREVEGDILLVDDADDRGGPAELYFDWSLEDLNVMNLTGERGEGPFYAAFTAYVDVFDVLGPSSFAGNSLASRVQNVFLQLIGDPAIVYQKILWNSSYLSRGLVGDGSAATGGSSGPEKSDDWTMLHLFMDNHPNNPGNAFWGDDLGEEWSGMIGPGAVLYRAVWMTYNLVSGDHTSLGESRSPTVYGDVSTSLYTIFDRVSAPPAPPRSDYYVAFGGCPVVNDFDVFTPGGPACSKQVEYPATNNAVVLAQATTNSAATTARCVLSGHGFDFIRDEVPAQDTPAHTWSDRTEVLWDILTWLENTFDEPITVDPLAFTNRLNDAYPNPFNPTTTIKFSVKEQAHVSLKVYNVAGQLVKTLVNEIKTPRAEGFSVEWDGRNNQDQPVSSGVYFYKIVTQNFAQTKKMVLLK